jgi:hypothetical protein
VIFSTNLDPEDLMDPAFLRRLPYKIEVGSPSLRLYERIFDKECERQGLTMPSDILDSIVHMITKEKGLELAAYHPRFIVDQVVTTCRFMGQPPHFEPRFLEYAIDNLRVRRAPPKEELHKISALADSTMLRDSQFAELSKQVESRELETVGV